MNIHRRKDRDQRSWPVAISVGILLTAGVVIGAIGAIKQNPIFWVGLVLVILGSLVSEYEVTLPEEESSAVGAMVGLTFFATIFVGGGIAFTFRGAYPFGLFFLAWGTAAALGALRIYRRR